VVARSLAPHHYHAQSRPTVRAPQGDIMTTTAPIRRRWRSTALVVAAALACITAHAASQAPVAAENGMVVSAQHLASRVGVDVLKKGGNAIDAAVAVGYAL